MDTLVSQYSRPMFQNEGYSEDEQQELSDSIPSLSLKFALPPVARVCDLLAVSQLQDKREADYNRLALSLPPCSNRRLRQPQLPYQACSRYHNTCFQIPRRYHRSHRFEGNRWKLDCKSNGQEGYRNQQ